jgi:hypothetical protein
MMMMARQNYNGNDEKQVEYLFRCECADTHFLHISWWPEDKWEPDLGFEGFITLEGTFWTTWRERLKTAWKVLFKRHIDTNVGIVLDQEKAAEIALAMGRYMHDAEASRARRDAKRAGDGQT